MHRESYVQPFRFLDLPPEVRLIIYRFSFREHAWYGSKPVQLCLEYGAWERKKLKYGASSCVPSLPRTCKQIREESRLAAWECGHIEVERAGECDTDDDEKAFLQSPMQDMTLERFLISLSCSYLRHLRLLTVNIDTLLELKHYPHSVAYQLFFGDKTDMSLDTLTASTEGYSYAHDLLDQAAELWNAFKNVKTFIIEVRFMYRFGDATPLIAETAEEIKDLRNQHQPLLSGKPRLTFQFNDDLREFWANPRIIITTSDAKHLDNNLPPDVTPETMADSGWRFDTVLEYLRPDDNAVQRYLARLGEIHGDVVD